VLGDSFDTISNPTSSSPVVNLISYDSSVEVEITATDSKGNSSSFTLTIYYVGSPNQP
jgi:archaellum component FlaF (FlaF/FlaG flagellin family)